jgi:hypothetical protein
LIGLRTSGAIALAGLLLGASGEAEAQKDDFLPLIQAYFDKEPVCVAFRKLPFDANNTWFQGNLRTLVEQGLLSEQDSPSDVQAAIGPSRRFVLTSTGTKFYKPDGLPEAPRIPVLCFARRQITGITKTEIDPPRSAEDDEDAIYPRKARISFSQRIVEIAPWAEAKPVQDAFSAFGIQLKTSGEEGKIEFAWKDGAWRAEPSYAFPLRDARQLGR